MCCSPTEEDRRHQSACCRHVVLCHCIVGTFHQRGAFCWDVCHGNRHESMDGLISFFSPFYWTVVNLRYKYEFVMFFPFFRLFGGIMKNFCSLLASTTKIWSHYNQYCVIHNMFYCILRIKALPQLFSCLSVTFSETEWLHSIESILCLCF